VDLSADFRLRALDTYEAWYGPHPAPALLDEAVYGLPELHREALRGASLVAAPGCYPTSALIPLAPLLREGLVEPVGIHIDAKSGVSGAGRTLSDGYLFAELDGNCHASKPGFKHRHAPEIEQEASRVAGAAVRVTFVPHLLPTTRGIATSLYVRPRAGDAGRAREALRDAYASEPFVRVLPEGEQPSLQSVRGSNFCDVALVDDTRNDTWILLSTLDNLCKGASGQAVQCANLACGFPETTGLLETAAQP
jgi:N-acetyl-gamma-glutamyl-phosphate reductase